MKTSENTTKLVKMGMLSAISLVLVLLIRIPFPPAPFLVYDPADIPILISGFAFGPLAGLMIAGVVSFLQAFALGGDGILGFLMHIIATGSFVIVSGLIYKKSHTRKGAVIALVLGSLVSIGFMIGWNLIITPIYMGVPRVAVIAMIIPVLLPFNLLKCVVNSLVTFILYKRISGYLHK